MMTSGDRSHVHTVHTHTHTHTHTHAKFRTFWWKGISA